MNTTLTSYSQDVCEGFSVLWCGLPCVQAWFVFMCVCSTDPAPSPPVRDIGLFNCGSPGPPYSDLDDSHSTANGVTLTALHDCILICF